MLDHIEANPRRVLHLLGQHGALPGCRAHWALLHVTVCLPDICAALESDDGTTRKSLYVDWCHRYVADQQLSGEELYGIRCKVLHEGQATAKDSPRYGGYAYAEPASLFEAYHKQVELQQDGTQQLVLDVTELSRDVERGVNTWIQHLEANPASPEAVNTQRHIPFLVRTRKHTRQTSTGSSLDYNRSS